MENVFTLNEYMNNNHSPEPLNHDSAEAALHMINFSDDIETTDETNETGDALNDGNLTVESPYLIKDIANSNKMQMVEYDHNSKPQRLGRPRNHVLKNVKIAPKDAAHNENKSKYMLYRLDNQPVEGPGSRGGKGEVRKQKGKITLATVRQRKQKQSQLLFSVHGLGLKNSDVSQSDNIHDSDEKPNNEVSLVANSLPSSKVEPKAVSPFKKTTSRTTVLNNRHKVTRQFPGPLIPLYYDMYDENFMNSNQNQAANEELLALGFPVQKLIHAADIIYIVEFVSRFSDLLGVGKLGPQDIEEGLGLDRVGGKEYENHEEIGEVSSLMNTLFARLLTLVLNRKPEVNPRFQGKAVSELRSMCNNLGLPREWKDNNEVYEKYPIDESQIISVDESKPEILLNEGYRYHAPFVYENPFNDKQGFEKIGFSGIKSPVNRLIMLRCLVDWSLTASNDIKATISDILLKQDVPGDKETYYASRAILMGFKHTEDLTREVNTKIQKKNYSEDNEMVQRYIEPVADPLQHPLRLRLDEQVVGDLGFHVGRFYFCRTASDEDGGLSSVKRMGNVRANPSMIKTSYAARFKLYVQDTHQMLVEALAKEGVEFNEQGEEQVVESNPDELPDGHFYEVAQNADELETFVVHLSNKLEHEVISTSSALYKPTKALYEHLSGLLPLLREQESLKLESRQSRTRNVNYSEASVNKQMQALMDDDLEDERFESRDADDDAYEEDEALDIPEDDEDGDYMD